MWILGRAKFTENFKNENNLFYSVGDKNTCVTFIIFSLLNIMNHTKWKCVTNLQCGLFLFNIKYNRITV